MKSLLRSSLFYGDVIGINGVQDKVFGNHYRLHDDDDVRLLQIIHMHDSMVVLYFSLLSLSVFRRRRRKEHCSTFSSVKMNTSIILTSSYNFYSYDHHIDDYRLRSRRLSSR